MHADDASALRREKMIFISPIMSNFVSFNTRITNQSVRRRYFKEKNLVIFYN